MLVFPKTSGASGFLDFSWTRSSSVAGQTQVTLSPTKVRVRGSDASAIVCGRGGAAGASAQPASELGPTHHQLRGEDQLLGRVQGQKLALVEQPGRLLRQEVMSGSGSNEATEAPPRRHTCSRTSSPPAWQQSPPPSARQHFTSCFKVTADEGHRPVQVV